MSAAPSATPVLELEEAGAAYPGGVTALTGFNLSLAPGEFCVILGPSGSGKSTLLRLVSGLVPPSSGQVAIAGARLTPANRRVLRRCLGMVHQDHGLVDRLSVVQNVMAGRAGSLPFWRLMLRLYPRPVAEAACRLIAEIGLTEAEANRRCKDLSGGQRQRVGIARALIGKPLLILADEPVASLDPKTARDILALLHRAAKERGVAVLCSLHQPELAREFADRIILMSAGRQVFNGPPALADARQRSGAA